MRNAIPPVVAPSASSATRPPQGSLPTSISTGAQAREVAALLRARKGVANAAAGMPVSGASSVTTAYASAQDHPSRASFVAGPRGTPVSIMARDNVASFAQPRVPFNATAELERHIVDRMWQEQAVFRSAVSDFIRRQVGFDLRDFFVFERFNYQDRTLTETIQRLTVS